MDYSLTLPKFYFLPGRPLSKGGGHTARMKNRHTSSPAENELRVVACFGEADLVTSGGADYELHNASADDCTAAKEWVSMFMHEAVIVLKGGRRAVRAGK